MTIWVVEMLCDGKWEPTVGVALSRVQGRVERLRWMDDNPHDEFRLRRYVPESSK